MPGLLDHRGEPIRSFAQPAAKKRTRPEVVMPRVGDAFGQWAGRDTQILTLPGGAVMQFDLSKLTLSDFRAMRQHYQLGASLNVLSFVMHGIDWRIECDDQEIVDVITQDLSDNWTPLVRGISQAFWAGYSPIAVNYRNADDGYVRIDKLKDLIPEESRIEWKKIEGYAPPNKPKPTIYSYDGLWQNNSYIPPENTLWYPLLMENGDYYGRKLLKPAFPSWFFSNLIHLFSNRYFERFGEPLPIGRAPFEDDVSLGGGKTVTGKQAMEAIVQNIRNRAVTVLPSDRDPLTKEFEYSIDYLESQMRGADFDRYLSRLDEEMSLSVFTPVLLFRTGDVGSYNLGQAHLKIFQQMLNAISGDLRYYLQNYLVSRLRVLNFGQNSPEARWVFRPQGAGDAETFKMLLQALIASDKALPDLEELGAIVGLKLDKVKEIVQPPPVPGAIPPADPNAPPADPKAGVPPPPPKAKLKVAAAKGVLIEAASRAAREYGRGSRLVTLGFKNRYRDALIEGGCSSDDAAGHTDRFYGSMNSWLADAVTMELTPDELVGAVRRLGDLELDAVAA